MELTAYNPRSHQQLLLESKLFKVGRSASESDLVIKDSRLAPLQFSLSLSPTNTGSQSTGERVEIHNHGGSIVLPSGRRIHGGATGDLETPTRFWAGGTCFELSPQNRDSTPHLKQLPRFGEIGSGFDLEELLGQSPAAGTLLHWFQSIGNLQRSVGGSKKLFSDAAHAVFDPGGLDSGFIIACSENQLEIVESFVSQPELGISFDRQVVFECIQRRKTVYHDARDEESNLGELPFAAACSPIFDHDENLFGVVYGSRCGSRDAYRKGIRPLEAQFVQVIAECVTAGLVRLAQEAEAARTRVQFEQVFSPKLVESLERDPELLTGREQEVTVLFCDMRDSSQISEQLEPKELYHFFGDVMDFLTQRITTNDGVVIDYFGDGLAAFWNAPVEQENHAELAVMTGLEIIQDLPELNESWRSYVGRNIQIGVGINTGPALVGNAGCRIRMKYGPRGKTVNVASRIESFTRAVGLPLLISKSTQQKVQETLVTRRVCSTELKGFTGEHDLFQPFFPQMDVRDLEQLRKYERYLSMYESKDYVEALQGLVDLEFDGILDPATEFLLEKTRLAIKHDGPDLRKPSLDDPGSPQKKS